MSLNLTLSNGEDGLDVSLMQTPTFITFMCLSYDPTTQLPDGGMEGVRRRYITWVESLTNGKWESLEDLEWERERIREHIEKVKSVKDPYFSFI